MVRVLLIGLAVATQAAVFASAEEIRELSARASEILSRYEGAEGKRSCLPVTQIESMKVLEDRVLLVEASGRRFYLNETPTRCDGAARPGRRLQYSTSEPQLCRGQIIHVVDSHTNFTVGSCSLGDFHSLVEKPAET